MAYDSDESGRVEVYVQSFPDPSLKTLEGIARERLGAALDQRRSRAGVPEGRPVALFGGPYPDSPGWTRPRSYDVTRDGDRFLLLKLLPARERPRVNGVLNWFEELRAKVPGAR